jgi:hypothetical protein
MNLTHSRLCMYIHKRLVLESLTFFACSGTIDRLPLQFLAAFFLPVLPHDPFSPFVTATFSDGASFASLNRLEEKTT